MEKERRWWDDGFLEHGEIRLEQRGSLSAAHGQMGQVLGLILEILVPAAQVGQSENRRWISFCRMGERRKN